MNYKLAKTVDRDFLTETDTTQRREVVFPELERYWTDLGGVIPYDGVKLKVGGTTWDIQFTVQNDELTVTSATKRT